MLVCGSPCDVVWRMGWWKAPYEPFWNEYFPTTIIIGQKKTMIIPFENKSNEYSFSENLNYNKWN